MSTSLTQKEATVLATGQQSQAAAGVSNGLRGASETDALRGPLEDADIFSTLFSKWGGDDAAEVSASFMFGVGRASNIVKELMGCCVAEM